MQRTNGNSIQRYTYFFIAGLSLVLAISYLQSERLLGAAAHAAGMVAWTLLAFGGAKGHRPKWFKFAVIPVGVLYLIFAVLKILHRD